MSFAPPYTGFTSATSNYLSSYGCTPFAHESATPSWSSTTGTFQMAGTVSASTCSALYTYASINGDTTITSPTFAGTHGGTSYVFVDYSYAVSARASLQITSSNPLNYSYASASVTATVSAYLIDVTNGSYLYVATTYVTAFGASFTSNGTFVLTTGPTSSYVFLSGHLAKGHVFEVVVDFNVGIQAYITGAVATASAAVNLAKTNGLTLTGIQLI